MSGTQVFHPELRVTLCKLVKRRWVNNTIYASERYEKGTRKIELTEYLGEGCSVVTDKSTRAPAGTFAISIIDRPQSDGQTLESIYGLIEPMDGVEIRMSHRHGTGTDRDPPIIMRGFVTRISRSQTVDGNGAPVRNVTITGHDYGKIWQMYQVLYRPFYVLTDAQASPFPLYERFGIGLKTNQTGADLFSQFFEKLINPYLRGFVPEDWPMPKTIKVETRQTEGLTSVQGPQNAEGSIHSILTTFLDVQPGFNEIYIEDRADGVYAVYRPHPAIDLDGTPIQPLPNGALPTRTTLPGADIISMEMDRTDENVANFFWVEGPRYEMVNGLPAIYTAVTSAQRSTVYDETYPNNTAATYGVRPMTVASQMGASDTFNTGQNQAGQDQRQGEMARWLDAKRAILKRTNQDNVILEQGVVRISGNENIRAGSHVELGTGALAAAYYVVAVRQEYHVFRGFFTTLQLERGQGFAKRLQVDRDVSPYLMDLGAAGSPRSATAPPSVGQVAEAGAPEAASDTATADGAPASTSTGTPA